MFLAGLLSGGKDLVDPDQERDPPPEPTPVTFPVYETCAAIDWNKPQAAPDFQFFFSKVSRPTDIQQLHVQALNIDNLQQCHISDMLPQPREAIPYPPAPMPSKHFMSAADVRISHDGLQIAQGHKEYEDRLYELSLSNDVAFQTIARNLPRGSRGPRIAYMRKFWDGLESMSQYWDCSLDRYYEAIQPETETEVLGTQRQRKSPPRDAAGRDSHGQVEQQDDDAATDVSRLAGEESRSRVSPRMRYKGRRTSCGRDMPDQFRADTVKAFVEGVIWPFKCALAAPRHLPIVQFNKLHLPVRQTAAVYRTPTDKQKARQGQLEGPVLGVQVRPELDFLSDGGAAKPVDCRLDLMRELGGLLQIAQERRREGKTEIRPGEGKWWTTRPRWGGGDDGEGSASSGSADLEVIDLAREAVEAKRAGDQDRSRRHKSPLMLWRQLKCGSAIWDPKTEYMAIGREPSCSFDEAFLISSVNHHICILKLSVHDAYMQYITSADFPSQPIADTEWCRPKLQRTKWFDLFDRQQRIEAFEALWATMAYLTREENAGGGIGEAVVSEPAR